jgi:hypothetical protein
MAVSEAEVRKYLDPEEPNYAKAAAALGADALPVLERLVSEGDPLLASKAAYLASLIPHPEAARVLDVASRSPEVTVRVAAAAGAQRRPELAALLENLSTDHDQGVRKVASRAAGARTRSQSVAPPDDDHGGGHDPDDGDAGERSPGEGGGSTDSGARGVTAMPGVIQGDGGGGGDIGTGPALPIHGASDGPDGGGVLPSAFAGRGDLAHGGGGG